ncbi:hypothetical protein ACJJIF_18380 [Microbulbifer sp. SSSA002]|uniref:hypothetical protein n=1 Tax=Microbulbifer sp. SSSA002 TaxID=3243376 RepID=UPI00403A22C4
MKVVVEGSGLGSMWREQSEPAISANYVVVVRYLHDFGAYDLASWNDNQWSLGCGVEVVV